MASLPPGPASVLPEPGTTGITLALPGYSWTPLARYAGRQTSSRPPAGRLPVAARAPDWWSRLPDGAAAGTAEAGVPPLAGQDSSPHRPAAPDGGRGHPRHGQSVPGLHRHQRLGSQPYPRRTGSEKVRRISVSARPRGVPGPSTWQSRLTTLLEPFTPAPFPGQPGQAAGAGPWPDLADPLQHGAPFGAGRHAGRHGAPAVDFGDVRVRAAGPGRLGSTCPAGPGWLPPCQPRPPGGVSSGGPDGIHGSTAAG
jgi:hypothetical protein